MKQWNDKETKFLKENYSKHGIKYCMEKLNFSKNRILGKVQKLGLKLNPEVKSQSCSKPNNKCNINPDLFYNITTKEISYLLGLMWADGFLNPSKNGFSHNLGLKMVKNDVNVIKPTLDSIGKWNFYERKQKIKSWQTTISVITNNKRIFNFLVENDYNEKSQSSADKILSKIPNDLKHYFFRGIIDGDGCFYYYKPKKGSTLRQFALAGSYDQDWAYFENLCNKMNIKYNIKRTINKKNQSSSVVRITNKEGIKKIGEYIYNNYETDKIGLIRKKEKFDLLIL